MGFVGPALAAYGGFWLVLDEAHLTSVTVRDSFRGHGYGRRLVDYLLEQAVSLGAKVATLEVRESNLRARNLYDCMSFPHHRHPKALLCQDKRGRRRDAQGTRVSTGAFRTHRQGAYPSGNAVSKRRTTRENAPRPAFTRREFPWAASAPECIEMGSDGRFRNVTINNNRTSEERLPLLEGAFLGLRVAERGRVYARLLQVGSPPAFQEAGMLASHAAKEHLSWRGLYPCAEYRLNDPKCPAEVKWVAAAPIVPYDLEASTLPVMLLAFDVHNTTDRTLEIATLFNWENINGCTRDSSPEKRGIIQAIRNAPEPKEAGRPEMSAEDAFNDEWEPKPDGPRCLGLEFGSKEKPLTNAHGHYCLMGQLQPGVQMSVANWNERDPAQIEAFWTSFHDEGRLDGRLTDEPAARSGAVCQGFELAPKQKRRVVYVLAWYCPRFEVEGVDMGNGYTNTFRSAVEVAQHTLKNHLYFFRAIAAWQTRLLRSSLPRWVSRMLINNNCVLSTNGVLTRDGKFAMFDSPASPGMGMLDRRFYSSIGLLLLYPQLETRALAAFANAEDPEHPGRVYRTLGRLCFHRPSRGDTGADLVDLCPKFVLMAYRNYQMTGFRHALDQVLPKARKAMEYMAGKDRDGRRPARARWLQQHV